MRNLALILSVTVTMFSCKQPDYKQAEDIVARDSVVFAEKPSINFDSICNIKLDSTKESLNYLKSENLVLLKRYDSLKIDNNKLGKELLHQKLIIQNAKHYLNIVNKNPTTQGKFLRGWMNRAFSQE